MSNETHEWDFFIAYSSADKEFANSFFDLLVPKSRVFLDEKRLQAGEAWDIRLPEEQQKSFITIVLVSRHTEGAWFAREEIQAAISLARENPRSHKVVPIFLESLDSESLKFLYGLQRIHSLSLEKDGGIEGVVRKLLALLIDPAPAPEPYREYSPDNFHLQEIEHDKEIFSVAFSPDGRWLAGGSVKALVVWDMHDLNSGPTVFEHDDFVYSVAFLPDSKFVVTAGQDAIVRLFDVTSRKLVWAKTDNFKKHLDALYAIALSPDGKTLATGSYDKHVRLWRSGGNQYQYQKEIDISGRVSSVAFSPNGFLVAIGSHDNSIYLWDSRTANANTLGTHDSSVESVAFSPDGQWVVSGGLDKKIRLWNVERRELQWIGEGHDYIVKSVAISPDGGTIVSASWDKRIFLWRTSAEGKPDQYQSLPYSDDPWHEDWIWHVTFSPDGNILASCGSDGRIMLWRSRD